MVGAGACGVLGARSWVASTGGTIREPYAAAAAGRLGSTQAQAALAPQVGAGDEQPRTRAACFEAGTRHEPGIHEGVPSLTTTTWHRVWMLPRQQTWLLRCVSSTRIYAETRIDAGEIYSFSMTYQPLFANLIKSLAIFTSHGAWFPANLTKRPTRFEGAHHVPHETIRHQTSQSQKTPSP